MITRKRAVSAGLVAVVLVCATLVYGQLPALGAGGLLYPARRRVAIQPPPSCRDATVAGLGVTLKGWTCPTPSPVRVGTVVYLHGVADNRSSSVAAIDRFGRRGFDVMAFDSRAHGESDGEACTYGFLETRDLQRLVDSAAAGPIILMGASLGAAVALQYAAEDTRVSAVIAAETFSDLRAIVSERVPWFVASSVIARVFEMAEEQGQFEVDAVSPVRAAARIQAPVLLIHGEADVATSPEHSRRVFAALGGPKQLLLVPRAGHNESLQPRVWEQIEQWVGAVLRELSNSSRLSPDS